MTQVPALWTKHRPIAKSIAREYRIPGMDRDDLEQEAVIALWEACTRYEHDKGPFPPFARTLIHRRLIDLLKTATRRKRAAVVVELHDKHTPGREGGRLELASIVDALATLSDNERRALRDHLNGVPARSSKRHENALYKARRKLKEAA